MVDARSMLGLGNTRPSMQYQQLNQAFQSDPRRILGQTLMGQGASSAPVRTPLQGLGRLSSALVGAYLQRKAGDAQVEREDERRQSIQQAFPNVDPSLISLGGDSLVGALTAQRIAPVVSSAIVPDEVSGGFVTKTTTTPLVGDASTTLSAPTFPPKPAVQKGATIVSGESVRPDLKGFTLEVKTEDGVVTGYDVVNKPEAPSGTKQAFNTVTKKPVFATDQQIIDNPGTIVPIIRGMQISINSDGTIGLTQGALNAGNNVSRKTAGGLESDILTNVDKVNKVQGLVDNFDPKYFQYETQYSAAAMAQMEKLGLTLDPAKQKEFTDYTKFMSELSRVSAAEINDLYGAVLSGNEVERAKEFIVGKTDSPTQALEKLNASILISRRGIARKQFILKNGLLGDGPYNKNKAEKILSLSDIDRKIDQVGEQLEQSILQNNPDLEQSELENRVLLELRKEFGITF
jgi:hypothetical protein